MLSIFYHRITVHFIIHVKFMWIKMLRSLVDQMQTEQELASSPTFKPGEQ